MSWRKPWCLWELRIEVRSHYLDLSEFIFWNLMRSGYLWCCLVCAFSVKAVEHATAVLRALPPLFSSSTVLPRKLGPSSEALFCRHGETCCSILFRMSELFLWKVFVIFKMTNRGRFCLCSNYYCRINSIETFVMCVSKFSKKRQWPPFNTERFQEGVLLCPALHLTEVFPHWYQ